VPDRLWRDLKEEAMDGSTTPKELVGNARALQDSYRAERHRRRVRAKRRGGRTIPSKDAVERQIDFGKCLSREEIKRAQVLNRAMIRVAVRRTWAGPEPWASPDQPVVARFREQVLGGGLATPTQAHRLLRSIGVALFEAEFFAKNGIPVLDHKSELSSGFDWEAPDSRRGLTPRSEVTFRWDDRELVAQLGERARTVELSTYPFWPLWRADEPAFAMCSLSIAGWLSSIAALLEFSCPWEIRDIVMFILIGTSPQVMPIDIGLLTYSKGDSHALTRVPFTIHPWVSSEATLKVYKQLQRILIGPRNRAPTMPSLEFFDFVAEQLDLGKTFRAAMDAWVVGHPRERKRYPGRDKSALSRFTNRYRDIERQVLRPFGRPDEEEVVL
jgi:hypothetical protein